MYGFVAVTVGAQNVMVGTSINVVIKIYCLLLQSFLQYMMIVGD